ncbi:hypothetical protein CYLTODRAFT_342981 [Cylindrobasidium torrendii FP15055 ss-10]|uniref:DNA helicase n=1 Tax=Cylindrobasidium torrendii FP15055 ss-10 TaxID=1314674 RepID=A0A0D7BSE8_9AGAR|nr:hypothetical protein CYLTODRAFT_342981 [Cylindrobasidium torrendii FP15055 ss-10]
MPTEPLARIKAAWTHSQCKFDLASKLLSDSTWTPPSPRKPSPVKSPAKSVNTRADAGKAKREAGREKGKQSSIYAHQTKIVPTKTPTKTATRSRASAPVVEESPEIQPSRRKRAAKQVVQSDSEFDTDSEDGPQKKRAHEAEEEEDLDDRTRTLRFFQNKPADSLQELTGCSLEHAQAIVNLRPFRSITELNQKLGQGRKKAGPEGISTRIFDDAVEIMEGYSSVDSVLAGCETIGNELRSIISAWTDPSTTLPGTANGTATPEGALNLMSLDPLRSQGAKDNLLAQPSLMAEGIHLKDYQLTGLNWLRLLYNKRLSCILADEMGQSAAERLGKTIQVISFFAYLKEKGRNGPHLIVVPSSTLENWVREFERFVPSINVQTYYGSKDERMELRMSLLETQPSKDNSDGWNVLLTTYNLAQGEGDRKFFRKIEWDSCVYDEGHVLKNFQSQRYQALLRVESKWRLLLTGTPLQNNLQELVSLLNFILPDQFAESIEDLRAIFKTKGDSKVTMLAKERVSRAKKMMTPFVLRRRKDQVLKDLPKKTERIEWCELSDLQRQIYDDALVRSHKTVLEAEEDNDPEPKKGKKGAKPKTKAKEKQYAENSANVLMDLRKAASHTMLFRKRFTDDTIVNIAKTLMREPDYIKRKAIYDWVVEDMSVMTDAELQISCYEHQSTLQYLQEDDCYYDSGKVQTLLRLLKEYREQGRKVLIFSQFVQVLNILEAILKKQEIGYLILTGQTAVDQRQSLCDDFSEEKDLAVFLLSTKAGGMGINLTAASVVIMFDQDFNPHNDRQAQDRAYRIGQKRDVDVVKLISRGTIEENMLELGRMKLALDEAVAGEEGDEKSEREMRVSLMNTLRKQFVQKVES